jgi:hypothetical protein
MILIGFAGAASGISPQGIYRGCGLAGRQLPTNGLECNVERLFDVSKPAFAYSFVHSNEMIYSQRLK